MNKLEEWFLYVTEKYKDGIAICFIFVFLIGYLGIYSLLGNKIHLRGTISLSTEASIMSIIIGVYFIFIY